MVNHNPMMLPCPEVAPRKVDELHQKADFFVSSCHDSPRAKPHWSPASSKLEHTHSKLPELAEAAGNFLADRASEFSRVEYLCA